LTPTDSIQKMLEGRQRKTEERRNKVVALIAEGKTVQEIAAMGIGSLNTIKNDVKEMGD
jgi:DNA-binding NarL/FixJ family response regulator